MTQLASQLLLFYDYYYKLFINLQQIKYERLDRLFCQEQMQAEK